jgi:branched-chain amino acid transport system ATP-binding protein
MAMLSVNNLEVRYGEIRALRDVSLNVEEGEVVTIIGANGAGKSTLLRAISGLLRPTSGSIIFRGEHALHTTAAHRIVSLGICQSPEGRQVFPNLTVMENLQLGAYTQRDSRAIAADLERCFELFPVLQERAPQRAGTLSGGEQQMLAIARALMARPTLLLLDEPSLGLAPLIVRKIFQILARINKAGTTIFLVEQNANLALTLAHRGYVLQNGQVIFSDRADELLKRAEVKEAYLGG